MITTINQEIPANEVGHTNNLIRKYQHITKDMQTHQSGNASNTNLDMQTNVSGNTSKLIRKYKKPDQEIQTKLTRKYQQINEETLAN
jgi:hypothetical protein